jgi:hypothetical protein
MFGGNLIFKLSCVFKKLQGIRYLLRPLLRSRIVVSVMVEVRVGP